MNRFGLMLAAVLILFSANGAHACCCCGLLNLICGVGSCLVGGWGCDCDCWGYSHACGYGCGYGGWGYCGYGGCGYGPCYAAWIPPQVTPEASSLSVVNTEESPGIIIGHFAYRLSVSDRARQVANVTGLRARTLSVYLRPAKLAASTSGTASLAAK
jgi:hypothetical protein